MQLSFPVKERGFFFPGCNLQIINNRLDMTKNRAVFVRGLGVLVGLFVAGVANADTHLTFQVDMSQQIAADAFNPATDQVWIQGSFNGWARLFLTASPLNTNVYMGAFDDTNDAGGAEIAYLFGDNRYSYETTADYNNRTIFLPTANGASLALPYAYFDDDGPAITSMVTFQVDMSGEINGGTFVPGVNTVEVRGTFEGWNGGSTMTNDPTILRTNYEGVVSSNVYVLTLPVVSSTNAMNDFKYVMEPGDQWETPAPSNRDGGANRWLINSGTRTLPVVYFSDVPVYVSNNVTFEVDMTTQIAGGNFSTNSNTVEVHGDFDGWSYGRVMTNNPSSATPNIFSAVVPYVGEPGDQHYFQYVIQPAYQWEIVSPANSIGGNRHLSLAMTNGYFTNGPVYFSDEAPSSLGYDFVTMPGCMVTFTVDMTPAINSARFFPGIDQVDLNGVNNGANDSFWTWGFFNSPPNYVMNQIVSSALYTVTVPVNMGQSLDLVYKYGINGFDNEAGFLDNHERWVRSLPNYTMPVDTFGAQGNATVAEPSFGNLTISKTGHQVNLSWIGRRGVHLQSSSSLAPGAVWTDLFLTDGTSLPVGPGGVAGTNYSVVPGSLFFRLTGPQ
jgi:hypothetical protein